MNDDDIRAVLDRVSVLLQENDLDNARQLCSGIIAAAPRNGRAQYLLGIVHARQGNLPEAEHHLRQAVDIEPGMAEAWLRLGQVCEFQGRHPEAAESLQRASALNPALLEPHESLGRVYLRLGRIDDAIERFRTVVSRMPASLSALDGLIRALRAAGRLDEAYQTCAQALSVAPDNAMVLTCMGQICRARGDVDEALDHFRAALRRTPGHEAAILGGAEALERIGQLEPALELLRPLLPRLDRDPDRDADLLILYARIGARLRLDDAIDERLERALRNPALDAKTRERMHFLLGDLYDRQARYDDAFAHYRAGNESVWRRLDDGKHRDEIDAIIAVFETLGDGPRPNTGRSAFTPIFIVGMPRSGTSLVEQMLACHPRVHGAGELNLLSDIAAELGYAGSAFNPDPVTLGAMARRYIEALRERAGGAPFVTDKLPGNFLFLGLIALLFPDAKILHTRRDPLDTCLSCYFQYFTGPHHYSYDLGRLGQYYRQYEKLMTYWKRRGIGFLDVPYEDLVQDTERVGRAMTAYCGLDWDAACLDFHRSGRVVATASYHQVNRPMYTSAIGRWKHYERHLQPLMKQLHPQRSS